jgi:hypothetical protein
VDSIATNFATERSYAGQQKKIRDAHEFLRISLDYRASANSFGSSFLMLIFLGRAASLNGTEIFSEYRTFHPEMEYNDAG